VTGIELTDKERQQLGRRNVTVVDNWSSSVTLCISSDIKRTVKFLCAVCAGVPIVGRGYLDAALAMSAGLPLPDSFALRDSSGEKKHQFCLSQALDKARKKPMLQGRKVFVFPSVSKTTLSPSQESVELLVNAAGGEVLKRLPSRSKPGEVIVFADTKALTPRKRDAIVPRDPKILFDSIFGQQFPC
jgi:hypothetical protein